MNNSPKQTKVEVNLPRTRSLTNVKSTQSQSQSIQPEKHKRGKETGNIQPALAKASNTNSEKLKGRQVQVARTAAHPLPKVNRPKKVGGPPSPLTGTQSRITPQVRSERGGVTSGRQASKASNMPIRDQIHSRLKRKSPWYDSIMSPMTGAGVKIPDAVGTETGTFQHVEQVSVAVGAGGIAGLRVITPYINDFKGTGSNSDGTNYQITAPAATQSNLLWSNGTLPGAGLPFEATPSVVKANCQLHRPVSACVISQPEISTLSDAGEMLAFVTPFDCESSDVSYQELQFKWDSTMIPVNKHAPLVARWYPLSADADYFDGSQSVTDPRCGNISYQDFMSPGAAPNEEYSHGVIPWEIGVVCSGMTASTGVVRFTIVVNYEFIPVTTAAMISTSPSPIDPTEDALVKEWVQDRPMTSVVSQKYASQATGNSHVSEENEPTGFGMLFNVFEEMIPYAKQAIKLLA